MNEESQDPWIDPQLEARIVALVLGEASDFERAELNRLIDQRPELATLKEQIQSVHGLLRDVGMGESVAEDDDWKLSAEKRSAVLAVMSGEAQATPAKQIVNHSVKSDETRRLVKQNYLWNLAKVAAVLFVVGFFGSMAIPGILKHRPTDSSGVHRLSSNAETTSDGFAGSESFQRDTHAPSTKIFMMDGASTSAADEEPAPDAAEFDYEKGSKASLSDIRDSLAGDATLPSPHYLMDDVQYLPSSREFMLPQEEAARSESGVALPGGLSGQAPPTQPSKQPALIAQGLERRDAAQSMNGLGFSLGRETLDRARTRIEPPAAEGDSKSLPDLVAGTRGTRESGRGQKSSPGQPQLRGGTALNFSIDPADPAVAEKPPEVDRIVTAGKSSGLGGGGGSTDQRSGEISAESKTSAPKAKGRSQAAVELGEAAQPQPVPPQRIPMISDHEDFDPNLPRYASPAYPMQAPANQPIAAGAEFKKQRNLAVDGGEEEETAKESLPMPSADDNLKAGRRFDSYSRSIPQPVTGTAIGLPRREFRSGGVEQDNRWSDAQNPTWGLRQRAEEPWPKLSEGRTKEETARPSATTRGDVPQEIEVQERIAEAEHEALKELNKIETYWERDPSKEKEKQVELQRQLEKLAINGQDRWYGYVPPMLEERSESSKKKVAGFAGIAGDVITRDSSASRRFREETKKSAAPAGLNEKAAADECFSTFSLHVSDVSFKLARAALARGEWPEAAKVRIEEFVNAFDYGDPMPGQSEKVACRVEQSVHPFLQQRNLLRVSMRTAAAGRSSNTPLRLTFLLDNSGSMERIDRQQTVRRAFAVLAEQLKPIDQVTLISFARRPRLLADKVSGAESRQLVGLIDNLPSEGGTNLEAALQLAFEKARGQQVENAQNRIILLTDGAVNLGDANPDSLSQIITTMRGAGIAFDAAGISAEGLNDEVLEALTRQGDGRYYLLDSVESVDDGFARQIAGALRPSAKNVKVQIEFNPKRVGRYKLLGFEKHRLKQEDFRNDSVDAAEMTAAEAGVAVYQFEAKPDGEGDVGSVSVRFRDLSTGKMIENRWPIPYQADAPRVDQAATSLQIAASAALLAAKLRGEPLGETVDLKALSNLISGLPERDRNAKRVQQLQLMIGQARQLSGK